MYISIIYFLKKEIERSYKYIFKVKRVSFNKFIIKFNFRSLENEIEFALKIFKIHFL